MQIACSFAVDSLEALSGTCTLFTSSPNKRQVPCHSTCSDHRRSMLPGDSNSLVSMIEVDCTCQCKQEVQIYYLRLTFKSWRLSSHSPARHCLDVIRNLSSVSFCSFAGIISGTWSRTSLSPCRWLCYMPSFCSARAWLSALP